MQMIKHRIVALLAMDAKSHQRVGQAAKGRSSLGYRACDVDGASSAIDLTEHPVHKSDYRECRCAKANWRIGQRAEELELAESFCIYSLAIFKVCPVVTVNALPLIVPQFFVRLLCFQLVHRLC